MVKRPDGGDYDVCIEKRIWRSQVSKYDQIDAAPEEKARAVLRSTPRTLNMKPITATMRTLTAQATQTM
jgi:hypothetical protein